MPKLPSTIPKVSSPLFVTWHLYGDELRGCIGTFSHEEIEKNLPKYAIYSAFKDSRFDPISKKEISQLSCAVSLLVNFKKAKDPYDWKIGTNGINIDFSDKSIILFKKSKCIDGTEYSGTFLPEVA